MFRKTIHVGLVCALGFVLLGSTHPRQKYEYNTQKPEDDLRSDESSGRKRRSLGVDIAIGIATGLVVESWSSTQDTLKAMSQKSRIRNGWVDLDLGGGTVWMYRIEGDSVKSRWLKIDGYWYYFNNAGVMYDARYHARFVAIGSYSYQFEPGGKLVENEGWKRAGRNQDKWAYWLPGHYGAYRNTWAVINDKWYQFDTYLIEHSGWTRTGIHWSYAIPGDFGGIRNQRVQINNEWYTFDANGYCTHGRGCRSGDY